MRVLRYLILAILILVLTSPAGLAGELRIAAWNLEHLDDTAFFWARLQVPTANSMTSGWTPTSPATTCPTRTSQSRMRPDSGKTQATKTIISELGTLGLPALILDFKDDYSDETFIAAEGFRLYDASFESLPFNPLTPAIDKRQGLVNPSQHIYQVANIIKRIYKLGDQKA